MPQTCLRRTCTASSPCTEQLYRRSEETCAHSLLDGHTLIDLSSGAQPQETHPICPFPTVAPAPPPTQGPSPIALTFPPHTCLRVSWWAERARTISGNATGTRRMRSEKAVSRHTHLSSQSLCPVKPCSRSRLWADTELALGSAPSWSAGGKGVGALSEGRWVPGSCPGDYGQGGRDGEESLSTHPGAGLSGMPAPAVIDPSLSHVRTTFPCPWLNCWSLRFPISVPHPSCSSLPFSHLPFLILP